MTVEAPAIEATQETAPTAPTSRMQQLDSIATVTLKIIASVVLLMVLIYGVVIGVKVKQGYDQIANIDVPALDTSGEMGVGG
jgi:hypothetical protein